MGDVGEMGRGHHPSRIIPELPPPQSWCLAGGYPRFMGPGWKRNLDADPPANDARPRGPRLLRGHGGHAARVRTGFESRVVAWTAAGCGYGSRGNATDTALKVIPPLTANRTTSRRVQDNARQFRDKAGRPARSRGRSPGSSASTETARLAFAQVDGTRCRYQPQTARRGLRRRQRRETSRSASCTRCRPYRTASRGGAARGSPASTTPRRTRTRRCTPAPSSRCTRLLVALRGGGGARGARGSAPGRGTRIGSRGKRSVWMMDRAVTSPGAVDMWELRQAGRGAGEGATRAGSPRYPPWTHTRRTRASRGGPGTSRRRVGGRGVGGGARARRRRSWWRGWTSRGRGAARRGGC